MVLIVVLSPAQFHARIEEISLLEIVKTHRFLLHPIRVHRLILLLGHLGTITEVLRHDVLQLPDLREIVVRQMNCR